jgi:hypothetical protein
MQVWATEADNAKEGRKAGRKRTTGLATDKQAGLEITRVIAVGRPYQDFLGAK